jgi:hemerythrin superfamily protein
MARAKTRSRTKAKSRTASSRTASRRTTARSSTARRTKPATRTARRSSAPRNDAVELLKSDHRQVEDWFEQFEKARSDDRKQDLATKICDALKVHTQIEEEIFYPAFYEATQEEDLHHEAIVEHDGAKKLIAEIESSGPGDEYYDARVSVLSEMIKHHVKEEEQRDGLFAKARSSGMDLVGLGEQLAARKAELESSPDAIKALGRARDAGKGLLSRLTSDL